MATHRPGTQAALVVIDTQVGVVAAAHDRDAVVGRIADLVRRARGAQVPVVWVQHAGEELVPGQPNWQIVPELNPAADEPLVPKAFNSAFQQTDLEGVLSQAGASHLVLCGAASNWCVRATAFSALDRGYDLTLAGDAHTTEPVPLGRGRSLGAAEIIAELNFGLNWIDYPGVSNRVCPSADIRFVAGTVVTPAKKWEG